MGKLIEENMDEKHTKDFISEHFQQKLDALKELRGDSINLLYRTIKSKKIQDRDIKDLVVLAVLLKYAISMLDSTIILLTEGAVLSSILPTRALFETWLYIEWILQKDSLNRAKYYYVADSRNQISQLNRFINGTDEYTRFFSILVPSEKDIEEAREIEKNAKLTVNSIGKLLTDNSIKNINEKFIKFKDRKGYEPVWHKLYGCSSKMKMAEEVSLVANYIYEYSFMSDIAHCANINSQVQVFQDTINQEPIRHPKHITIIISMAIRYILNIHRRIIVEYRPAEEQNFKKKYKEKWQEALMNMPIIDFNPTVYNLDDI